MVAGRVGSVPAGVRVVGSSSGHAATGVHTLMVPGRPLDSVSWQRHLHAREAMERAPFEQPTSAQLQHARAVYGGPAWLFESANRYNARPS